MLSPPPSQIIWYVPVYSFDTIDHWLSQVYRVIDGQKNKSFWDDIETVAKHGLKKLVENRRRSTDSGTVHSAVQDEVLKIFKVNSIILILTFKLKLNLGKNLL